MEDLVGKHILITGGSTGIGLVVIRKSLLQGATKIAVLDIRQEGDNLTNLQTEFGDREIVYFATDVADKENVRRSFEAATAQFGHLDVVIGNAGIGDESRPEVTVQVNLMGIIHTTYAAIDALSKDKGGRGGVILNVASMAGLNSLSGGPSYSASKHGVVGFTNAFSHEFYYLKHGIQFITVCPGFTLTPFITDSIRYDFDPNATAELFVKHRTQTADEAAAGVLQVLRTGNHGSLWRIVGGEAARLTIPAYFEQ